jgi:predicted nucleic acid-binding protein
MSPATNYLLDTNAISEAVKSRSNDGYMSWLNTTADMHMYISCLTIGEIQKGVALTKDSLLRERLNTYLSGLYEAFSGRILRLDTEDGVLWGNLTAIAQQSGLTLPVIDALIAAQCLHHHMVLVTRNVKDFAGIRDLEILSPWSKT